MSIKYANPKTYGAIFQKLVNGYRKVKGKEPTGLDLIKIKLEAADQVKQSEKIIKFPEEKITPFYEERPSKGPQADIKSFPKKQTNQPTSLESINKLVKDLQDIYEKSPTLTEIMGVSNKYPKKEGIVKITTDYLKTKDEKGIMDEVKKIIDKKGSYVDLSEEERRIILGEAQDLLDNPKKTAEEIIDEGDFDPSGMMNGGRIGYFKGKLVGLPKALDKINKKFGSKAVTTADKIARPEKAVVKDLFDEFNKRLKQKTTDTEVTLPNGIKGIIDTTYEPKIKKFEGMSKIILSPEEAIKLAKKEKLEGIESLLSGEKVALSRGAGKGLMVNQNGKIFIREKIKDRPNPIKEDEKAIIEEFDSMFDEEPVQMSMDDLIKYRSENPAGKGRFTRAEAIIARLENTIQNAKNNPDETSDYVLENFPNMIKELKNKPELANNKNVWKELGMTGLPENQRFKIYDDGTVDFETLKPTHQFKLRDDITKHATGGRVGFSAGGIDKVRRALLKMFGGAAATGVAVKTGLGGLLKGGEKAKDVVKTAETVKTAANTPPNYVFDLIKIIKAKGKDITKQAGTIERETVTSYRGVELYETPNGVVIRAEGKTPYEGGKEIQLSLNKTTDVVDEGKKTQKQVSKVEYEEATVRPDPEGKMKDVDFYVDETDHAELKRIVDEEKGFKSGGLAYMLGE